MAGVRRRNPKRRRRRGGGAHAPQRPDAALKIRNPPDLHVLPAPVLLLGLLWVAGSQLPFFFTGALLRQEPNPGESEAAVSRGSRKGTRGDGGESRAVGRIERNAKITGGGGGEETARPSQTKRRMQSGKSEVITERRGRATEDGFRHLGTGDALARGRPTSVLEAE